MKLCFFPESGPSSSKVNLSFVIKNFFLFSGRNQWGLQGSVGRIKIRKTENRFETEIGKTEIQNSEIGSCGAGHRRRLGLFEQQRHQDQVVL